jgi:hypothetical protein
MVGFLDYFLPAGNGLPQEQQGVANFQGLLNAGSALADMSAPQYGPQKTALQLITGGLQGYGGGAQNYLQNFYQDKMSQAQINNLQNGGLNTPSSVREWQFYNQIPEDQRENYMRLKRADQVINLGGQQGVRNPVTGQLEQFYQVTPKPDNMPWFKGAQRAAVLEQDLKTLPEIERLKKEAEATVAKSVKNTEDLKRLKGIQRSLDDYSATANDTMFTGPVLGPIGDIVKAPGRTALTSAGNELALRAKDLLNFPSANFSDADRNFMVDIVGGKYAQYGGIEKVVQRMKKMTESQIDNILQGGQQQQAVQDQQSSAPKFNPNAVPPKAVDLLRQNPNARDYFDQKYGDGAATYFLGQ